MPFRFQSSVLSFRNSIVVRARLNSRLQRAFTLLEFVAVIAILIILAGLLMPLMKRSMDDARLAKTLLIIRSVRDAVHRYWVDTNRLPEEDDSIAPRKHDLFVNAKGVSGWKGPYLDQPLTSESLPWSGVTVQVSPTLKGYSLIPGGGNGYNIDGAIIEAPTQVGAELLLQNMPYGIVMKIDEELDGKTDFSKGVCEYKSLLNPAEDDGPRTDLSETKVSVAIYLFHVNR